MKRFGLIGYPLSHSYSEQYFSKRFGSSYPDYSYRAIEIPPGTSLKNWMAECSLLGFNVTLPYKEKIIPWLHEIDDEANEVGAVNCVVKQQGRWKGYNTDVYGFRESLLHFIPTQDYKALILGNGGAARAVRYVLQQLQIPFLQVSRNECQNELTYADLTPDILTEYRLLIQCTPVGMYPQTHESLPLPYHWMHTNHFAFDLIYNPAETLFLQKMKMQGAQIKNGMEMLELQAEASFELFIHASE
ncbi:MAG TPA: shikimate dehydrogenase [Chitinophagaceae bacterium]|nr:shikimate dehydrogenase [Chitinophagaceae bacterium]HNF72622.1 shikimate dehydrogenase [Chitinophagaceae bacterium]